MISRYVAIFTTLGALLLAGCETLNETWGSASNASPRLYVFDCGRLNYTDISSFGISNEDTQVRSLFVPCYLIEHQGKKMIWDTGVSPAIAGKGEIPLPGGVATASYDVAINDQLAAMGIATADIDYLALSHMHWDHSAGAPLFKDSTWIAQRAEHEAAYAAEKFRPPRYRPFAQDELADSETIIIDGDYDVFGDGKVKMFHTPGHTPGHMVLLVDLENTGPVILSGDLYHFRMSRTLKTTPLWNVSRERTLVSMDRLEEILKETGAQLWIEHDLALAESLNLAPAYYD